MRTGLDTPALADLLTTTTKNQGLTKEKEREKLSQKSRNNYREKQTKHEFLWEKMGDILKGEAQRFCTKVPFICIATFTGTFPKVLHNIV